MTIKEVSEKFEISADTLRYYEIIGLIPTVNRTSGGIRDYNEADCGWIEFIKCMRSAGVQVEALIEYVSLFQNGDISRDTRKQILVEQKDILANKIEELQETYNKLEMKISGYDDDLYLAEKSLKNR